MIDTTIQKYLYDDNSKPVLYDIKNYFAQILQFDITDSNLTKWKKYKSYKTHRYSAYGIDCDVSLLAVQVYQKGWDFLKSIRPTKQYERVKISNLPPLQYRCGDSGEILFSSENIIADEIKEYSICIIREYKYQFILKNESPAEYYRGDTMTSFSNIYNHYKNNFFENKDISNEIEKLAKNHHAIGNMIPVPTGFNTSRVGNYAIHDYWDLTMLKIKEWFDNTNNDLPLKQLLHNNEEAVLYCKKWLSKFNNNWNTFVEKNYLQSFVDKVKDENGDYKLMLYWAGHSYDNDSLPTKEKEFLNFLKLLNGCIEDRNEKILEAIKQ